MLKPNVLPAWGGELTTIEKDADAFRVGGALLGRATDVDTSRCRRVLGASGDVLPTLRKVCVADDRNVD